MQVTRLLMRVLIAAIAAPVSVMLLPSPGSAQIYTIRGRVITSTDRTAVSGATIMITGREFPVLTDENGQFRLLDLSRSRYVLSASGVGYEPADTVINLVSDTIINFRLKPAPVEMAPLNVNVRNVSVRGDVRERANNAWVIDAAVYGTPDCVTRVNLTGRFKCSKVPTGTPFTLRVESFSFLPYISTFEPQKDTTLLVNMEPDPAAMRMIANLERKIDERSAGARYKEFPVMERDAFLKARDEGLFLDVMKDRIGTIMMKKLACVVLDERYYTTDRRLPTLLADEVHRMEVIMLPGGQHKIMVRVYTRTFMADLMSGKGKLVEPAEATKNLGLQCTTGSQGSLQRRGL